MGAAQPAVPDVVPPGPVSFVIERAHTEVRIGADGLLDQTRRVRVRVNDEAAVAAWGRLVVPFIQGFQTAQILNISIERDGRQLDLGEVVPEEISAGSSEGNPDGRALHVAIPALRPGDVLTTASRSVDTRALLPGHVAIDYTVSRYAVTESEVFEVSAPPTLRLAIQSGPDITAPTVVEAGDVRRWTWEWRMLTPVRPADPHWEEILEEHVRRPPDILIGNFESWDALARWYGGFALGQVRVDSAIRAKAEMLTAGKVTLRERLAALHDFVAAEVRYLDLPLGSRRFLPRPAPEVLSTLYGDCKDQVVLLTALAGAIGIRLDPVFIHTRRELEERVPSLAQFDHVIAVHEGQGEPLFWMDPTAQTVPAGELMDNLRERQAVRLLRSGGAGAVEGGRVVRTPALPVTQNESRTVVAGSVGLDGRVGGRVVQTLQGDVASLLRLALRIGGPDAATSIPKGTIEDCGFNTARGGTIGNEREVGDLLRIEGFGETRLDEGSIEKGWHFSVPAARISVPSLRANDQQPMRRTPLRFGAPQVFVSRSSFELPLGFTAEAPKGASESHAFADYTSEYSVNGRRLTLTRTLRTNVRTLAPEQFAAYETFKKTIDDDRRRTFKVTPPEKGAAASGDTARAPTSSLLPGPIASTEAGALADEADRLYDAKQYRAAAAGYRRAIGFAPENAELWNALGTALEMNGQPSEALAAYAKTVEIDPANESAIENLAHLHGALGQSEEAERAFRRHLELAPGATESVVMLALLLQGTGRAAEALTLLDQHVSDATKDVRLLALLARSQTMLADTTAALVTLDRASAIAESPREIAFVADALLMTGAAPDRARRYARRAAGLAARRLEEAELTRAGATYQDDVTTLLGAWRVLGFEAAGRDALDEAEPYLLAKFYTDGDPRCAEAMARLYLRSNRPDAARRILAECLVAVPGHQYCFEQIVPLAPEVQEQTALVDDAREHLLRRTTLALPRTKEDDPSERLALVLSFDSRGQVDEVRPLDGAGRVPPERLAALMGLKHNLPMPTAEAPRLVLVGLWDCSDNEVCRVSLAPGRTSLPVDGMPAAPRAGVHELP